jgi:hypothetical protein
MTGGTLEKSAHLRDSILLASVNAHFQNDLQNAQLGGFFLTSYDFDNISSALYHNSFFTSSQKLGVFLAFTTLLFTNSSALLASS